MADFQFPKSARLLKSADFERVFQAKNVAADGLIVVYAVAGSGGESRLGLVVSRKCGNAVTRNRWKRLLREAFRMERGTFPATVDVVILPRRGAEPKLVHLRKSLGRLLGKLQPELERSK